MNDLTSLVRDGARYLERNRRCGKHHIEHIGSNTYLLDFYSHLGEIDTGKAHINYLLLQIVEHEGAHQFYPGSLDPMNMSNSVIDTGACVDSIARFLRTHRDTLSAEEHSRYGGALRRVVETYLSKAVTTKPITNQRLWGLTGVASFAAYAGEEKKYSDIAHECIEWAFRDMTVDGFFRYYPEAQKHGAFDGYDGITTFYQSRCIAFIRYSLELLKMDDAPYRARLESADRALLSMYRSDGTKDLRLECKRWYWQGDYEVAASGFDIYALAHMRGVAGAAATNNALYQLRRHFFDGYLHSHIGAPVDFQCPIFWTAHLAWALRTPDVGAKYDIANRFSPFSFRLAGTEVFSDTTPSRRILIDARWQKRNPTVGIFDNGLPTQLSWSLQFPSLPPSLLFSLREVLNHSWYALRGGYVREMLLRLARFALDCMVMLLPRYDVRYGKIESFTVEGDVVTCVVRPATKYGMLAREPRTISIAL